MTKENSESSSNMHAGDVPQSNGIAGGYWIDEIFYPYVVGPVSVPSNWPVWQTVTGVPVKTPHKCPVCRGTGLVSIPPGVAGDVETYVSGFIGTWDCRACVKGVIWHG